MKALFKTITLLLLLSSSILADETGSASIFSFLNGVALEKNEVLIDGSYKYFSDEDGSVELILEVGTHQIEIFAKDENGANLGYAKKSIEIKEGRDTQVIATFNDEGLIPQIEVDTPLGNSDTITADKENTGLLHGLVLTSDKNLPIPNARVFVKGTSIDAKSDENGNFYVEIPADVNISISIVHSEYSSQTLNNIVVQKDDTINKEIKLTPASMELEEFIVLAPKVQGSIATIMAEEKENSAITNIVGAAEMSKKGDSTAAGALRRVTGVTLVDGTDVYVRGLGGRYSNVEMNSLPLPSPDPQRRTVPLDIFPSAVISSMKVQKSATADIPASFGGGYVDIRTKGKTKENYLKITTEMKQNSNSGKAVNSYEGSTTDWMGVDDGYRYIPVEILNASQIVVGEVVPTFDARNNQAYTTAITNRLFTSNKETLPLGGKMTLEGAYNLEIADKHELSFFANYSYGQDHTYREEKYFKYSYNKTTDSLYTDPEQYGDNYTTLNRYTNAGMFNLHYNYADVFNLKYTKLYSKISEKVTKVSDGIANSDDDWKIRYDLNWEERTLDVNQLTGDLKYEVADFENIFTFGSELALADLNQPSNYKYAYLRDVRFDGVVVGEPYLDRFSPNAFLNLTSQDELFALSLNNKTILDFFSEKDYIEVGLINSAKTRESRYNKYLMNKSTSDKLTDDIDSIYDASIRNNYDETFRLDIAFQPAYWYDAQVDETSYFTNFFLKPLKELEILIGARQTNFTQTVYQYTNNNDALAPIESVPESLAFNSLLPSLGIKYIFDKKNQLNFAFAQTYIVPDLREFTSAEYFHPYEVATVQGNPDLVNTNIYNYDLKYSHYFSDTESLSFGVFYKYLDKPIEDVQLPSSSLPRYSYDNADYATLYGFEIDGRKSFNTIHSYLKNYYISGNFSYTKSVVSLREEQISTYTTNNRELQGLSPMVINASLGYESKGRDVTLSYNKMGERIRKVGMVDGNDEFPDFYEVPPQVLDFVWIEGFDNGLSLKLKCQNLLDEETIWYQGSTNNITNKFKVGRFYSLAIAYKY
ncbi:TonB-dependent receptor plug domain-containing protein [Sulfurimonas aquatica]|uniref:TonB-dependent receptor plug domain-containing protein n=1 Tax=Sulfurimonas aquatica TaxID=2672570 RepID=A0A975B1X1_9BACT|nr:carboxypeptidase-like regulatory domain-containing protein [Sulfurimonas aquatica]QSZ42721.1 TonB-dependent receptor plug domain-containing protein [Sulfurimonas aquatica]